MCFRGPHRILIDINELEIEANNTCSVPNSLYLSEALVYYKITTTWLKICLGEHVFLSHIHMSTPQLIYECQTFLLLLFYYSYNAHFNCVHSRDNEK